MRSEDRQKRRTSPQSLSSMVLDCRSNDRPIRPPWFATCSEVTKLARLQTRGKGYAARSGGDLPQRTAGYNPANVCAEPAGIPFAGLVSEPIKIVQAPRLTMILYEVDNLTSFWPTPTFSRCSATRTRRTAPTSKRINAGQHPYMHGIRPRFSGRKRYRRSAAARHS